MSENRCGKCVHMPAPGPGAINLPFRILFIPGKFITQYMVEGFIVRRFHPVISIVLGFLGFIFPVIFLFWLFGAKYLIIEYLMSFMISGFLATYFTRERKIRYALYESIVVSMFFLIIGYYDSLIVAFLFIPLGGLLGKIADKKSSWDYSFNPVISIILGLIITFLCNGNLNYITGLYQYPVNSVSLSGIAIAAIALVPGGFVSTFLAREKKIQYGIYFAIVFIIVAISLAHIFNSAIKATSLNDLIIWGVAINAVYLAAALAGGYLGIITAERLKVKS